jgi:hypothetical protein
LEYATKAKLRTEIGNASWTLLPGIAGASGGRFVAGVLASDQHIWGLEQCFMAGTIDIWSKRSRWALRTCFGRESHERNEEFQQEATKDQWNLVADWVPESKRRIEEKWPSHGMIGLVQICGRVKSWYETGEKLQMKRLKMIRRSSRV